MHIFFAITALLLLLITPLSSNKSRWFIPSPRQAMAFISVLWLIVWGCSAIFKTILPDASGSGVISAIAGLVLVILLIFAGILMIIRMDEKHSAKRSAALKIFRAKQRQDYGQTPLIEHFNVTQNQDTEGQLISLKAEIVFKRDPLIEDRNIKIIVFVDTNSQTQGASLYENGLFSSRMALLQCQSESTLVYQVEIKAAEIRNELNRIRGRLKDCSNEELTGKDESDIKLDYSVYVIGPDYITELAEKPGICFTSLSDEALALRDYYPGGSPYEAAYPALSNEKLMLNTRLRLTNQ
ncbi:hypothetical protein [Shewanella algae]